MNNEENCTHRRRDYYNGEDRYVCRACGLSIHVITLVDSLEAEIEYYLDVIKEREYNT
tara:strand:+ start:401 stop:574 length:174 start_codon:yes stop_codon:yes gene_type:complete